MKPTLNRSIYRIPPFSRVIFAAFFFTISLPLMSLAANDYRFERTIPVLQNPWYFNEDFIAVDHDGIVYITDTQNHRIQNLQIRVLAFLSAPIMTQLRGTHSTMPGENVTMTTNTKLTRIKLTIFLGRLERFTAARNSHTPGRLSVTPARKMNSSMAATAGWREEIRSATVSMKMVVLLIFEPNSTLLWPRPAR